MFKSISGALSINQKAPDQYPMIVHRLTSAKEIQDDESKYSDNDELKISEEIWTLNSSSFNYRKRCSTPTMSTLYSLCAILTPVLMTGGYLYWALKPYFEAPHNNIVSESPTMAPTALNVTTPMPTLSPTQAPSQSPTDSPTQAPFSTTQAPLENGTITLMDALDINCTNNQAFHQGLFNVSPGLDPNEEVVIHKMMLLEQDDMLNPYASVFSDGQKKGNATHPITEDPIKVGTLSNNSFTSFQCLPHSSQRMEATVEVNGNNYTSDAVYKIG